ncbi:zgc:103586 isoform X2 [Carassius gibelio]|uniref:zgc:103586 isoform X2 n=1 Tax=Carassius gibelio TaxID=101364 RepID=UPI0022787BB8|nr:zgc:103586 isoform X2 [Carassius gibelio]
METIETAAKKSFIATGLGVIHLHECPVQPNLPIYVTVIGLTGLLSLLVMYLRDTLDDSLLVRFCSAFSFTLYIFIVCWFVAGTHWIYSIYPPNYVPTSTGDHCHKTLYLFAFWINNLGFLCVFMLSLFALYFTLTRRTMLFTSRNLYVKI